MGRLGGPRGWVREGDVPPPAPNAESLSIHVSSYQSSLKAT